MNKINEISAGKLGEIEEKSESLFVDSLYEITKLGKDLAKYQRDNLFNNKQSLEVYFEEGLKMKKEGYQMPKHIGKRRKWYSKKSL